jgi:hypothetical protein
MGKKNKQHGSCVFCGSINVTKQHVWPDWLKSIVPRKYPEHFQMLTMIDIHTPGIAVLQPDIRHKRGPSGTRKIRNVCAKCNSGWMSRIESAAKPMLTDLILGKARILDNTQQLALSTWITLISIVAEYTDKPTLSIPTHHRRYLMEKNLPPEGWRIWIGAYSGVRWGECHDYRHFGLAIVPKNTFHSIRPECNTQFSTFVIGSLLIHAASTTIQNLTPTFNSIVDHGLEQIWPSLKQNVTWPTSFALSDEHVDYISDAFFRQLSWKRF